MTGSISKRHRDTHTVNGLNQINEILIPFMDKNPIFSERASHYLKFKTVSTLLKNSSGLS
jgi:hypothetical protein